MDLDISKKCCENIILPVHVHVATDELTVGCYNVWAYEFTKIIQAGPHQYATVVPSVGACASGNCCYSTGKQLAHNHT